MNIHATMRICNSSRVANRLQWLSLWFSLNERSTEQLQCKMQTPPASYSPPSSILHISFFLPSFLFNCWWLLFLMHRSILKRVTDKKQAPAERCLLWERVYASSNNLKLTTLCFPSYSKGNSSVEYSIEHSAVKIPVVRTLCWPLARE